MTLGVDRTESHTFYIVRDGHNTSSVILSMTPTVQGQTALDSASFAQYGKGCAIVLHLLEWLV